MSYAKNLRHIVDHQRGVLATLRAGQGLLHWPTDDEAAQVVHEAYSAGQRAADAEMQALWRKHLDEGLRLVPMSLAYQGDSPMKTLAEAAYAEGRRRILEAQNAAD